MRQSSNGLESRWNTYRIVNESLALLLTLGLHHTNRGDRIQLGQSQFLLGIFSLLRLLQQTRLRARLRLDFLGRRALGAFLVHFRCGREGLALLSVALVRGLASGGALGRRHCFGSSLRVGIDDMESIERGRQENLDCRLRWWGSGRTSHKNPVA